MKYFGLIFSALGRRKLRTVLTAMSIFVAFVLFGYLVAIRQAFNAGIDVAGQDRLVVRHKVSIIQLLPESYTGRLERLDGVESVSYQTWFGGVYVNERNFFAQIPVDPERHFSMYPEYLLPDEQMLAWKANRRGAVAGRKTADKFGWKVGDRIPLQPTIWRLDDPAAAWEFDLVGIYDGAESGTDTTQFFFRYDYFDEARQGGGGQVGWFTVRVTDPERAEQIASSIDAEFANSPAETKAEPEGAFAQAFAKQTGDIGSMMMAIMAAVFFTILLVAGNTMAQAVRERTQELAVLKSVGFTHRTVLGLVLAESCLLAALGGLAGLALSWVLITRSGDPTGGFFPIFYIPGKDLIIGVLLVFGLGFVAGIFPAIQAMRLRIADGLRR